MASFAPGPSATPSSDATDWQDITDDVAAAASSFTIDELLSADTFSLFESMSACELLDPKMDALGNEAPQPSVEERLRAGTIPLRLELGAALRVLDRLLALEVAWFAGASAHESVLTCFYARDPVFDAARSVDDSAGTAAVVAAVACSLWALEAARVAALRADIYEEEDFCASSGASGSGVGTDDRARALALAAEERLEALGGPDADAAARHVRHRRLLVEGLAAMLNTESSNATVLEAMVDALNGGGDAEGRDRSAADAAAGDAAFGPCRDESSATRGAAIKEGGYATYAERAESRAGKRRLASGLLRVLDLRRELAGFRFSSPDGARVPEALQGRYAEHGHLRVLRLVDLVGSEDRGGGRLCLPRSLAALELGGDGARLRQLLSHDDFGVHASSVVLGKGAKKCSVYSLVTDSLLSAGAPSCILSTRPGAEFAARAARATLDAARVATANRARLRARLPNLLLDWAALVQDGIEADGLCAAALGLGGDRNRVDVQYSHWSICTQVQYLYNWALRHSLLLMEQCLALDVHLELIASPKELEQVFWYWEYLLAARGTVASSAARHRVLCANANAAARAADPGYDDDAVYVAASLRFSKRFAHFSCFADPPHVSFADYERVAGAQRGGAAGRLADSASDLFQNAKQLLDQAAKIGDPAAALARGPPHITPSRRVNMGIISKIKALFGSRKQKDVTIKNPLHKTPRKQATPKAKASAKKKPASAKKPKSAVKKPASAKKAAPKPAAPRSIGHRDPKRSDVGARSGFASRRARAASCSAAMRARTSSACDRGAGP
ncbi:hypothetical protein JL720_5480 [Aureococcus anophagefferens]|nr:hypothetical protein JL720_5480 [Aureococcus anophagefferens]